MTASDLISKDKILEALGLESRRSTTDIILPAVGIFAAGLLVGAGLGVLFAPKAGTDLRHDITDKIGRIRNRNADQGADIEEGAHH